MKNFGIALFIIFCANSLLAQNEGEITGKVLNQETNEGIPYAHMKLTQEGKLLNELQSDENGIFVFKPLSPGKYDIMVTYVGYDTAIYTGLTVTARGINYQEFLMSEGIGLVEVVIRPPLISDQNPEVIKTFSDEDLGNMALDNIVDAVATVPAVQVSEKSGGVFIGGSREDATLYVIDGVRVIGSFTLPMSSIKELNVITGGIPASYGDVTGGIVEITTKGYSGAF